MARLFLSLTAVVLGLATASSAPPAVPDFLMKPAPEAIRILSWNVYRNSIFPSSGHHIHSEGTDRPARFARVLRAVQPDILCLQAVTRGAPRTAALIEKILPLKGDEQWQAQAGVDTVIVSRFALGARGQGYVEDGRFLRGHAIAVLQTPASDLFMVCAHFQSKVGPEEFAMRVRQAEMVATAIRKLQTGNWPGALRSRTPFIVLGDFNAMPGATAFLRRMTVGSIDPATGKTREGLDWDGSRLIDALPRHNGSREQTYTWRNDTLRYPPSALDRILYSGSVLTSVNQFVLDTTVMSESELAAAGLRASDVMANPDRGIQDHYPLVIDLTVRKESQPH